MGPVAPVSTTVFSVAIRVATIVEEELKDRNFTKTTATLQAVPTERAENVGRVMLVFLRVTSVIGRATVSLTTQTERAIHVHSATQTDHISVKILGAHAAASSEHGGGSRAITASESTGREVVANSIATVESLENVIVVCFAITTAHTIDAGRMAFRNVGVDKTCRPQVDASTKSEGQGTIVSCYGPNFFDVLVKTTEESRGVITALVISMRAVSMDAFC